MSDGEPLARKFDYLVAMPVPTPERQCVIERMPGVGRRQLVEWWTARQELGRRASELQARLWRSRTQLGGSGDECAALRRELAVLSQKIVAVVALWDAVYANANWAGASNAGARGFWMPRWQTLGADDVGELTTDASNGSAVPGVLRTVDHCGPSLVLESAALCAMRCACAQQIAMLDVVASGDGALLRAIETLGYAQSACTQVCAVVLWRHATVRNGCESVLLSQHYFEKWMNPLVRAQAHYCRARLARAQAAPLPSLLSAFFFIESGRCLRTAQRSIPVHARLDQLARHRQASCALVLAQAFFAVHTYAALAHEADADHPIVYASQSDGNAIAEAPHTLLVEALACVRVAFLLLEAPARNGPVARFFDKLLERLVDVNSGFVPTLQTSLSSAKAVRDARRSMSCTSVSCGDSKISILCKHRAARSASVSLDSKRVYELRVPYRYAK